MVNKPLQGSAGRPGVYTDDVPPLTPQHPVQGSHMPAVHFSHAVVSIPDVQR